MKQELCAIYGPERGLLAVFGLEKVENSPVYV